MILVGIVSCYREGRLVQAAIESLCETGCERVYVYEGPAGPPLEQEVPESVLPNPGPYPYSRGITRMVVEHGRWRTDARKRQAILDRVHADYPAEQGPVWGVIVDGDELLLNGWAVRDLLQQQLWRDEVEGGEPTSRYPIAIMEGDGSLAIIQNRLLRLDLIRSYEVSTSILTTTDGQERRWGNLPMQAGPFLEMWLRATEAGRLMALMPWPGQPLLLHRSGLRHPLRQRLRMHEQEASELARRGLPVEKRG